MRRRRCDWISFMYARDAVDGDLLSTLLRSASLAFDCETTTLTVVRVGESFMITAERPQRGAGDGEAAA